MPIYFNELEDIIKQWKSTISLRKSNYNHHIVGSIESTTKKIYLEKIQRLFKNLDMKDIIIQEELDPSRTYGKLRLVQNITVKNSRL